MSLEDSACGTTRGLADHDDAKNGAAHRDGARDLAAAVFARLPTL